MDLAKGPGLVCVTSHGHRLNISRATPAPAMRAVTFALSLSRPCILPLATHPFCEEPVTFCQSVVEIGGLNFEEQNVFTTCGHRKEGCRAVSLLSPGPNSKLLYWHPVDRNSPS